MPRPPHGSCWSWKTNRLRVQDGYLEVQQNKPSGKIYGIAVSELPSQCVQGATVTAAGYVDDEGSLSDLEDLACR